MKFKIKTIYIVVLLLFCTIFYSQNWIEVAENIEGKNILHSSDVADYGLLWAKYFGDSGIQGGFGIAIDSESNIYQGAYTMDGPFGRNDGLLIKTSNSGSQFWNRTFGGLGDDLAINVAIDSKDYIYVVGTIGGYPVNQYEKMILLKYDKFGNQIWNRSWSELTRAIGKAIVIDSEDNIYIAGHADYIGTVDLIIIKYDSIGSKLWQTTWGGSGYEGRYGLDLSTNSLDDLYVAAQTTSYGAGDSDAVLIKYSKFGIFQWNYTWGGASIDCATSIVIDKNDIIYISGETDSFANENERSTFLASFTSSGYQLWNYTWKEFANSQPKDMRFDSKENLCLVGNKMDEMEEEFFIAVFDKLGNHLWNTTWNSGASLVNCFGVAIDVKDNIFVSGYSDYIDGKNDMIILLKYSNNQDPDPFYLYSDSDDPDTDGNFNLIWTDSDKADNYSIYTYTSQITEINGSLTLLAYQTANSAFSISGLGSGCYYYIIVAYNSFNNTVSNCISVDVKFPPGEFTLSSDAGNPDDDGFFNLIWTDSAFADNYSIFQHNSFISNINDSLSIIANQTALSPFLLSKPSGIFYFIAVAYNETGSTLSNCISIEVTQIIITIQNPTSNELFSMSSPSFSITLSGQTNHTTWYSLDGGITNIIFTGSSGTIQQSEWNKFSNGTVTIGFYANDSANYISYESVTVRKDVLGPSITVNSPQEDDVIGFNAPNYDLSIEEFNLDSIWYSFDYGMTVLPLFSLTGTLDQAEWGTKGGGTIPLRFYANDSLGHESFIDVTVIKDLTLPLITINSPDAEEIFGETPPDFDISISESNLDSYWYTLDGGSINISMSSFTGTIDQTEWDKLGDGTVTITFHAKDEGGNEGSAEIMIKKDINLPLITINSPQLNNVVGFQAPEFDLSIVEPNIDTMWYTLDNGLNNITFTTLLGTINETEWDKFGNGLVIIRFYIRDISDNEAFAEVQVNKDLITPVITLISPLIGAVFEDFSPIYSISIEEANLGSFWYSLDGGATNITITALSGAISEIEWNTLPNGHATLMFYAKDEGGNIGKNSVLITKNSTEEATPPPGIPGYDLYFLIGVISVISTIFIRKRLKS